jgi:hypothetical protein
MRDRRLPLSGRKQQRDAQVRSLVGISSEPAGLQVHRCYQKQTASLDDLADVLELLLLDGPDSHGTCAPADRQRLAFQRHPSEECV